LSAEDDPEITYYNQLYEANVLFKQQFDMEMQRFKLALFNSLQEVLTRLPE